ncbi:MAG: hypothetical protein QNK11_02140 [Legionella sp.]|nr:hypothetical protein [Legionella sp.]
MPSNYREIDFKIADKDIIIAGMARPGYRDTTVEEDIQFLSNQHYTMIIGLQPEDFYQKVAQNCHPPIEYIAQSVKDFYPPTIEQLETISNLINTKVAETDSKFVIHCGEGFGRTGTVLAALKLKELMMAISPEALINEDKTEKIKLGQHASKPGLFDCTPMVKKAIETVRSFQNKDGSVEKEGQVNQLHKYQRYLIQKLKKDSALVEVAHKFRSLKDLNQAEFKTALDTICEAVVDGYQLSALLGVFDEVNRDDVFFRLNKKLSTLIHTAFEFNDVFEHLNEAQREFVLENLDDLKFDVKSFIEYADDLGLILQPLNSLHCKFVLDKLKPDLLEVIKEASDLNVVLTSLDLSQTQLFISVLKAHFKKLLSNGFAFALVVEGLKDVQIRSIFAALGGDLTDIIHDDYELGRVLRHLNQTLFHQVLNASSYLIKNPSNVNAVLYELDIPQRLPFLMTLQDKLPEMVSDLHDLRFLLMSVTDEEALFVLTCLKDILPKLIVKLDDLLEILGPLSQQKSDVFMDVLGDTLDQLIVDEEGMDALSFVLDAKKAENTVEKFQAFKADYHAEQSSEQDELDESDKASGRNAPLDSS